MKKCMILATDRIGGIGLNNELLFKCKPDMKFFVEKTKGCAVIMGRKTFESIGMVLPNRFNIVITTNPILLENKQFDDSDIEKCPLYYVQSLDEAFNLVYFLSPQTLWRYDKENCFVIGGTSVYNKCINEQIVDTIYLNVIDHVTNADSGIKQLDYLNKVPDNVIHNEPMTLIKDDSEIKADVKFYTFNLTTGYV